MSQSLPTPGGDVGTWGIMLNGFLNVSHNSDGTLSTSAVSTAGAEMTSNKNQASGYAGLNSSTLIPTTYLGTGTGSSSNFLRGDGSWQVPPTASNATTSATGLVQLAGDLGGTSTSATAPTLAATTNVETIISANTTVAGALQKTNNLSDVSDTGSSRANLHIPALTPAAAIATSSIAGTYVQGTATFTPTSTTSIDGYTFAAGDLLLLTAQGNASNGLWQVPISGSTWTRPTEFATGATIKGRSVVILNGSNYANTVWVLDAATAGLVIDTANQTWTAMTLVNTATNEQLVRANSLDQMSAPNANVSWNNNKITTYGVGTAPTDVPAMSQSGQWITDANTWTFQASFTATATPTSGSGTLTSSAAFTNVVPGMDISGTGIPSGTIVLSIASTSSLTMSQNATSSPGAETVTFASSVSTFYVSGNQTSIYKKGLKLKWVQSSTTYYGVVYASAYDGTTNTRVTTILNTSYSIQNATISAAYYSWGNPSDFPTNFLWTPIATGFSSAPTVPLCWWALQQGLMTVVVSWYVAGTSGGTAGTTFTITNLPIAASTFAVSVGTGENNGSGVPVQAATTGATTLLTLSNNSTTYEGSWTASGSKIAALQLIYPV